MLESKKMLFQKCEAIIIVNCLKKIAIKRHVHQILIPEIEMCLCACAAKLQFYRMVYWILSHRMKEKKNCRKSHNIDFYDQRSNEMDRFYMFFFLFSIKKFRKQERSSSHRYFYLFIVNTLSIYKCLQMNTCDYAFKMKCRQSMHKINKVWRISARGHSHKGKSHISKWWWYWVQKIYTHTHTKLAKRKIQWNWLIETVTIKMHSIRLFCCCCCCCCYFDCCNSC